MVSNSGLNFTYSAEKRVKFFQASSSAFKFHFQDGVFGSVEGKEKSKIIDILGKASLLN